MGSLQSKNEDTRQLFWLALFATTLGLFIVAKGNLFYYIFGELVVTEIVLTVAIVIVIPSMIRIHLNMYKDNKIKKIFEVFFSILVILVGIVLIFEKTLNKYMDAVLIVGIVCLALLVGLVVLLIKDIKNAVGLSRFLDIGMFIIYGIVGGILITLICFDYIYFINIFEAGFMLIGAVLLLFVMLYYSFKIKEYMEQLSEDKVLQTLAYIDPLTGMMNRTKYEEELNSIRKEKYSICTIISFDLNYLKKINDLYGHEMGDEYIKSFAKSLRIGLEDKGFVARIGGDEFIAIIKDKIINIENVVEEIQTLLVSAMHEHKDVEISFAYGSAISKKGQKKTIDELIELSDKKMYENKRKIKEKR